MIKLGPADFVSLEQLHRAWRFTDPKHNLLPPDVLADIRPLTPSRTAALSIPLTRACAGYYSDTATAVVEFSADSSNDEAIARTGRDLAALSVADEARVVVSWDAVDAVETSWRTFSTYWDDFCYPSSDDVTIYPLDGRWVLCYHHTEWFSFGTAPPAA